mmetsp:Transcript_50183/g.93989  ORF Transcript_50183/g.93989 Transcript_50183/m.93989 type:complete len:344 (-) Transcript_50183:63-1094(-)
MAEARVVDVSQDKPTQPATGAWSDSAGEKPAAGAGGPAAKRGMLITEAANVPEQVLTVPQNVYGVAALCGLLYENENWWQWVERCGCTYLHLAVNYAMQIAFLVCIWQIHLWQHQRLDWAVRKHRGEDIGEYAEGAGECWKIAFTLYSICQIVFVAYVCTEIQQTFDKALMIHQNIPTTPVSEVLRWERGDDGPVLVSGGMSQTRKMVIFVFIVIPKLGIAVALIVIGGQMLASTGSNTDLVFNTLAVNFVQDADELIFNFLAPSSMKHAIEALPPFKVKRVKDGWQRRVFQLAPFWKMIVVVLIAWIHYKTALVCPTDPCENYPCIEILGFGAADKKYNKTK